jgi:hypothetical protein
MYVSGTKVIDTSGTRCTKLLPAGYEFHPFQTWYSSTGGNSTNRHSSAWRNNFSSHHASTNSRHRLFASRTPQWLAPRETNALPPYNSYCHLHRYHYRNPLHVPIYAKCVMLSQNQPPQLKLLPSHSRSPPRYAWGEGRTQEKYPLYIVRSTTDWLEQK